MSNCKKIFRGSKTKTAIISSRKFSKPYVRMSSNEFEFLIEQHFPDLYIICEKRYINLKYSDVEIALDHIYDDRNKVKLYYSLENIILEVADHSYWSIYREKHNKEFNKDFYRASFSFFSEYKELHMLWML